MAESQKVTHPNRINHYIMVAEVKKPKKLLDWKKSWTKASPDHPTARLIKKTTIWKSVFLVFLLNKYVESLTEFQRHHFLFTTASSILSWKLSWVVSLESLKVSYASWKFLAVGELVWSRKPSVTILVKLTVI